MPDLQKLNYNKERILNTIKIKGPSLPVKISKAIELSPLFTSALLSELYAEKRLKISNMKVGSSPLYYAEGQEHLLENFIQHLNRREQEALSLLKSKKILSDEEQQPVIRVALRAIKDFAIPIRVRVNEKVKIFWKYLTLPDQEIRPEIQKILNPDATNQAPKTQPKPEKPKPIPQTKKPELKPSLQPILTIEKPKPLPTRKKSQPKEEQIETPKQTQPAQPAQIKKKKQVQHEFPKNIKEYLAAQDIELLESLSEKKKEFISKIRIDTLFGKQEYFLMAKDKKKINENDLTLALQKAQAEKMPALLLSKGEPDKKAKAYIKEWQNLIKFEKLKF